MSDTKNRQSFPAVIAEASQSTRYGSGSVAEAAIRDLLTQTQRGILAELAKKLSDVVLVVVKEKNDNKNNIKQQGTTKGSSHGSGKMLSNVVESCPGCRKKEENDNKNNIKQQGTTKGSSHESTRRILSSLLKKIICRNHLIAYQKDE